LKNEAPNRRTSGRNLVAENFLAIAMVAPMPRTGAQLAINALPWNRGIDW
jgi:hypothetical protein